MRSLWTRLRLWLARLILPKGWIVRETPMGWIINVGEGRYQFVPGGFPDA